MSTSLGEKGQRSRAVSSEEAVKDRHRPCAFHDPVMKARVLELLVGNPEGVYVDATVGGGGHSLGILELLGDLGRLICLDRDPEAVAFVSKRLPAAVFIAQKRFSQMQEAVKPLAPRGVAGVLMDLGVSSHQLDTSRGFSFQSVGQLDLRMDPTTGEPASQLLARLSLEELINLIRQFGEDTQARRIARAIIAERDRSGIHTTEKLAQVIGNAVPATRIKSCARVFQALRIAVNQELEELKSGLEGAWQLLTVHGRLVVLTYNSLEDRITKHFMKAKCEKPADADPRLPSQPYTIEGRLLTRKPEVPSPEEILANPRARSAKLRAIEKIPFRTLI